MKKFIGKIKNYIIAGFFFLLPVFIIFVVLTKAWTYLTSLGTRVAGMFGMKTIIGMGSATVFSAILFFLICILFGMLVQHLSFLSRFHIMIEKNLSKFIPGYDTYKSMAEEKLQHKQKIIPYTPALLKRDNDCLQPVFIIEKDEAGNNIILAPAVPETNKGELFIVREERLLKISSVSANQFDEVLRKSGAGLLNQHHVLLQ